MSDASLGALATFHLLLKHGMPSNSKVRRPGNYRPSKGAYDIIQLANIPLQFKDQDDSFYRITGKGKMDAQPISKLLVDGVLFFSVM